MTDHFRGVTNMVKQDGIMTDDQREAIRARNLAKSFHGQSWADIDALLAEVDRLREIALDCPLGLNDKSEICSAGTCRICLAARFAEMRDEVERLRGELDVMGRLYLHARGNE